MSISCLKHVGRDARAVGRGGGGLARAAPGGRSQPRHAQEGVGERGTAAAGRLHGGEGRGQLHIETVDPPIQILSTFSGSGSYDQNHYGTFSNLNKSVLITSLNSLWFAPNMIKRSRNILAFLNF